MIFDFRNFSYKYYNITTVYDSYLYRYTYLAVKYIIDIDIPKPG